MSRPIVRALAVLCLSGCVVGTLAAQDAAATLKELNALLASSCSNNPTLTLADGIVVRKDGGGATFTFKLGDIGEVLIDPREDAEAHVLLPCKDDKPCVEYEPSAGAAKTPGKLIVFSINPASLGPQVVKAFKGLQASSAGAAKK
jgi:hypothetical protein